MKHSEQVVIKRWGPILKEYEKTKSKVTPRMFLGTSYLFIHWLQRKINN